MRPKRQALIDGLVIVLLAVIWLYDFKRNPDAILFAGLSLAIIVLAVRLLQRAKEPSAEDSGEKQSEAQRREARFGRRLAAFSLGLVILTILLVGPQLLLARAISLHTEHSVNDRGHEVIGNHLLLGTHDLASIRADLEGAGQIASENSMFAAGWGRIYPLGVQLKRLPGEDPAFGFEWELKFGWPFVVRSWTETQILGPGGVRWAVISGQQ